MIEEDDEIVRLIRSIDYLKLMATQTLFQEIAKYENTNVHQLLISRNELFDRAADNFQEAAIDMIKRARQIEREKDEKTSSQG